MVGLGAGRGQGGRRIGLPSAPLWPAAPRLASPSPDRAARSIPPHPEPPNANLQCWLCSGARIKDCGAGGWRRTGRGEIGPPTALLWPAPPWPTAPRLASPSPARPVRSSPHHPAPLRPRPFGTALRCAAPRRTVPHRAALPLRPLAPPRAARSATLHLAKSRTPLFVLARTTRHELPWDTLRASTFPSPLCQPHRITRRTTPLRSSPPWLAPRRWASSCTLVFLPRTALLCSEPVVPLRSAPARRAPPPSPMLWPGPETLCSHRPPLAPPCSPHPHPAMPLLVSPHRRPRLSTGDAMEPCLGIGA